MTKVVAEGSKDLRVGLAYNAFKDCFAEYYPKIEVVESPQNVRKYDLIIFPGGEDIHPASYGQRITYSSGVNKYRDDVELSILKSALRSEKKVLGICRGCQLINIYFGGSIAQDIFLERGSYHPGEHVLEDIVKDSIVDKFFARGVNSYHHQGIFKVLNSGLTVTSTYSGIVESVESSRVIGLQFHPEFMGHESKPFFDYILNVWATAKVDDEEDVKYKETFNFNAVQKEIKEIEDFIVGINNGDIRLRQQRNNDAPALDINEFRDAFVARVG